MTRQALRTEYPFHFQSPRHSATCCKPRKLPRRTWLQRVRDEIARLLR